MSESFTRSSSFCLKFAWTGFGPGKSRGGFCEKLARSFPHVQHSQCKPAPCQTHHWPRPTNSRGASGTRGLRRGKVASHQQLQLREEWKYVKGTTMTPRSLKKVKEEVLHTLEKSFSCNPWWVGSPSVVHGYPHWKEDPPAALGELHAKQVNAWRRLWFHWKFVLDLAPGRICGPIERGGQAPFFAVALYFNGLLYCDEVQTLGSCAVWWGHHYAAVILVACSHAGATLFLLLHGIWYLHQPENCENGLNKRTGNHPSSTNVFKEQAFSEIESRIYYLSRHWFPCVPTVIIFMFSLPTQVCNYISDWMSM